MGEIAVSICCNVYNHEKYLRKCLDSFINQRTSFEFEILIHDDASTDNSKYIIQEYERKFPEIIKPIYQNENQFSKGNKILWIFQYPRAKGKYIALCEGDDFWTDSLKLQKQYEVMEKNNTVSACVHSVRFVSENDSFLPERKPKYLFESTLFKSDMFLQKMLLENLCPFQTSSFFMRNEYIQKIVNCVPSFFRKCSVGDVPTLLYMGYCGDIYFLSDEMSCYRTLSIGSWSLSIEKDINKKILHDSNLISTLKYFNEYTNKQYDTNIQSAILRFEFKILLHKKQYRMALSKKYKKIFKDLSWKEKIYLLLHAVKNQ